MTQYIGNTHAIIVDEQTLIQMVKDTSAGVMPMLIEHYITEAAQHTKAILDAANEQDFSVIQHESHTLGSSSMALGNIALSDLAREIESSCQKQDYVQAIELIKQLEELADKSLRQLNERKEKGFEPTV